VRGWRSGFLSATLVPLLLLSACTLNRHSISNPGTSQVIRVEALDRFHMDLEEDSAAGCRWYGTSDDPDVDVRIDHQRGKDGDGRIGAHGTAEVTIRIHRGYDGPSTVTFAYKRRGEPEPIRKFTINLYKRTGDSAAWE